ncbi:MAG: glycosyltransferase family 2 protein [Alistipes sp.]|nr:glycosyltransferase family 2 protein [Alistipes sp.]
MSELVSVIVPTYSRPINLLRAINSILHQTYKNIEIIVVDDNGIGSKEQLETQNVLSEYIKNKKITYIPHEVNLNGSAARNTGLKFAKGKYIAFLDDDDQFVDKKIEIQVLALKSLDESWGGCYCNTNLVGKLNITLCNEKSGNLAEDLLLGNVRFNTSSLLLRKEVFDNLNGFDVSFERHQDWEFMMRYFRRYKIFLPTSLPLLNKFSSRMSSSNLPNSEKLILIKEKFLNTFESDIRALENANKIYHEQWMQIVLLLLCEKKYKLCYEYLQKSIKYSPLTVRDFKLLFKYALLSLLK